MGKNRKPFINKKTASTYHLLHRSQRDVGGVIGGDDAKLVSDSAMILWPSPHNRPEINAQVLQPATAREASSSSSSPTHEQQEQQQQNHEKSSLEAWKVPLEHAGVVDDYDYDQHLKPITGTGVSLGVHGVKSTAMAGLLKARSQPLEDTTIREVSRQLESIALTADCMDDDVAQALFDDFEDGEFEELNDDFILMAAQEPEQDNDDNDDQQGTAAPEEEFDFDAHIRRLMEKAKSSSSNTGEQSNQVEHDWAQQDNKFFSKAKPLYEGDEEDEDNDDFSDDDIEQDGHLAGMAPTLTTEEQRVLCERFEQALAEYETDDDDEDDDDEQDGDTSLCDGEARGTRTLEGGAVIEAALDDFLHQREQEIFFQGNKNAAVTKSRVGGSGFSALVGGKMVNSKDLLNTPCADEVLPIQQVLEDARETLAQPLHPPPPEEILIDGKSYFSERPRNPWDCESILSTYSNLDNNPVTIGTTTRRTKKTKSTTADLQEAAAIPQIFLSKKTGLPLGVLDSMTRTKAGNNNLGHDVIDVMTATSINKGLRNRDETADEKKARKDAIKEERRLARLQKKALKTVFQSELRKRDEMAIADFVNGKAVFRIS